MNTLASNPVAALLDRLFAIDESASPANHPSIPQRWKDMSQEQQHAMVRSKTDYTELYLLLKDIPLSVSRETGRLLYMLVRSTRATTVVEFGTSFGLSTICLAAGLRDNGGGRLITSEFEPSKVARAQANLEEAGLAELVDFREGDALETLSAGIPDEVDLLLLDGAKPLYLDILALIEPRLRVGGLVVADNADFNPEFLSHMRDPARGYLTAPCGSDVELSLRVGS
ncbi:O-methyltransferase [Mycolicibacterium sphagni]|uniref:Methyltransferase n=1 Tax=Mycolicibacterium sphagni TaxID=1786 RepID=A0A255DYF4_9MYCO|nr:O-methyltransferase [Mycolicibacterium sphagni]OYN82142.1 methyltransferase [Mycolicibacterium sphagni]